jgi:Transglycosylase SLT domain
VRQRWVIRNDRIVAEETSSPLNCIHGRRLKTIDRVATLCPTCAAVLVLASPGIDCAPDWTERFVCPVEPGPGAGATPGGPYAETLTDTEEAWRELVAEHFCHNYAVEEALHVIACESNGDPDAVNPISGTTGLLQIDPGWFDHPEMGDPFDPEDNIAFGGWLWRETGGWSHFHCRPVP